MSKKQPATPSGVTQLGKSVALPELPDQAELERVANPHADTRYVARFTAPEFTCLCPVTGQPDFAHFVIDYVPKKWLIESKSLKLYLASFRNHGAFHEDCTVAIGKRIASLIEPHYLRIGGYWFPARRHADRRLLAGGDFAGRYLVAGSGSYALQRAGLTGPPSPFMRCAKSWRRCAYLQ